MSPIAAVIHYGDNHRRTHVFSLDDVPGFREAQVTQVGLIAEQGIIGLCPDLRFQKAVDDHGLGIDHSRRWRQRLRHPLGVIARAVPGIVGTAKRREIPLGPGRGLHVIQKRKHALYRVHAEPGGSAVKGLEPRLGGSFPDGHTRIKLNDYDLGLIHRRLLCPGTWHIPKAGKSPKQETEKQAALQPPQ